MLTRDKNRVPLKSIQPDIKIQIFTKYWLIYKFVEPNQNLGLKVGVLFDFNL